MGQVVAVEEDWRDRLIEVSESVSWIEMMGRMWRKGEEMLLVRGSGSE